MIINIDKTTLVYSCPFRSEMNSCEALNNRVNSCPIWENDEQIVCKDCPLILDGQIIVNGI
jgi:hypothetical protein